MTRVTLRRGVRVYKRTYIVRVYIYCIDVGGRSCRCSGCGSVILDQYILRVAPDLEWHASCLKCAECGQFLDEMRTCFVRDGKTFCKTDYLRQTIFGIFYRMHIVRPNQSSKYRNDAYSISSRQNGAGTLLNVRFVFLSYFFLHRLCRTLSLQFIDDPAC